MAAKKPTYIESPELKVDTIKYHIIHKAWMVGIKDTYPPEESIIFATNPSRAKKEYNLFLYPTMPHKQLVARRNPEADIVAVEGQDTITNPTNLYSLRETLLNNYYRKRLLDYSLSFHPLTEVRIYSYQWGSFWRENGSGYTEYIQGAGVYTLEDAYKRVSHTGYEKDIVFCRCRKEWSPTQIHPDWESVQTRLEELINSSIYTPQQTHKQLILFCQKNLYQFGIYPDESGRINQSIERVVEKIFHPDTTQTYTTDLILKDLLLINSHTFLGMCPFRDLIKVVEKSLLPTTPPKLPSQPFIKSLGSNQESNPHTK